MVKPLVGPQHARGAGEAQHELVQGVLGVFGEPPQGGLQLGVGVEFGWGGGGWGLFLFI